MNYYFTIITICKNAENIIEETLISVLEQEYEEIEYIVIDGASNDSTNDIINRYMIIAKKKNIKMLHISEPDKGISDAFNKGIQIASGDIIGLINAGDTLLPGALKYISKEIKYDTDIIYGNTICRDKKNNISYLRRKPENVDYSQFASKGLVFTHQSAFVKKTLYDAVGLYNVEFKIIMDTELFIRFYNYGAKFQYIDRNLVSMLAGGISSSPSKRLYYEHLEIGRKYGGVNKKKLIFQYILNIPIAYAKKIAKKNRKVWMFLIGKKRSI